MANEASNPAVAFHADWSDGSTAHGKGRLFVAGTQYWPRSSDGALEWDWIELLEFLADHWVDLVLEQALPDGVQANSLQTLNQEIALAVEDAPVNREEETHFRFQYFLERHDLAYALHGVWPRSVFIQRTGNEVSMLTESGSYLVSATQFFEELADVGNTIAEKLKGTESERAQAALHAWEKREKLEAAEERELQLLGPETDRRLLEWLSENDPYDASASLLDSDSPCMAVARMTGPRLATEDTLNVLDTVKRAATGFRWGEHQGHEQLETLSRTMLKELESLHHASKPYEQGYQLAQAFRRAIGLKKSERSEPQELLAELGVGIEEAELSEIVQAIGLWSASEGPRILVNTNGRFSQSFHGRRATLAHELCHLLIDRDGAVPLAEVLGGSVTDRIEQRANAFAAEFLLPRAQVRKALAARPAKSLHAVIDDLRRDFGVGFELTYHQIRNDRDTFSALSSDEQQIVFDRLRSAMMRF